MTICPYDHHACSCQPDEGVPCRGVAKIEELVKRLRDIESDFGPCKDTGLAAIPEAADALEAQAARVKELEEAAKEASEEIQRMRNVEEFAAFAHRDDKTRIAALEADVRHYKTCYDAAVKINDEAVDRIAALEAQLELYREAVRVDPTMEGPRFAGANSSSLRRAWEHDRATLMSALRNTEKKDG